MKNHPNKNINNVIQMRFLGVRQYLEDNLKDKPSCLDLLRGPVSGRHLSKYTGDSLYNLVRRNKEYILDHLKDNSRSLCEF